MKKTEWPNIAEFVWL